MSFLKDIKTTPASDPELIRLYKEKADISVLGELYQPYMDLIYAVCLKYLRDPEAAKDAVMSIFEELVTKLTKYEVANFRGWLYTLAKNHCLMQLRSDRKISRFHDPDFMQIQENDHLNEVTVKELHLNELSKCIDTLSPDQKQSVQLFYLKEKSYKEIAGITKMEWNKVRSLIQNARRNLKLCMEKNKTSD